MAAITTLSTAAVATGWGAVGANAFDYLGSPLPLPQLVIALSLLIVGSLLVGVEYILRGPGFYRAMRVGEAIGEEKARRGRDHGSATPGSRMEVTTG